MMAYSPALFDRELSEAAALLPFQEALNGLPTAAERKQAIISAVCMGLLSKDDCQLLFDVYDLATA